MDLADTRRREGLGFEQREKTLEFTAELFFDLASHRLKKAGAVHCLKAGELLR